MEPTERIAMVVISNHSWETDVLDEMVAALTGRLCRDLLNLVLSLSHAGASVPCLSLSQVRSNHIDDPPGQTLLLI